MWQSRPHQKTKNEGFSVVDDYRKNTQKLIGNNFIYIENSFIYQLELKRKYCKITDNPLNFPEFYTLGP